MEIRGIKAVDGLSDLQSLYIALQEIDELLVGFVPADFDVEIDIEGAKEYAKQTFQELCELDKTEKSRFIKIKKGD